ncbi:MAG: methylenetetrahydrofolate--tRNA-(uracil(54)-C(5))-methyltransferase (FADH(2)-oxidizing) TrmFO [Clostridia bacterium]|nr:methylenetetrahydrofolate--tRNA-(uracil(54)-C(5))-methyltransferase (FADH(2)-oxidizing) TrmFO [Clostridia bacterium]
MNKTAAVIGGGFAGVEAAVQLARAGVHVDLYEMKPHRFSPAHSSENLAELVCSNSFKAERLASAAGLLKTEMERLGSLCVECAKKTKVPAGGALAVDRDLFSAMVTQRIEQTENITVIRREVSALPQADCVIIAAGPLASDALSPVLNELCGEGLHFFDAAAPIVSADSIDPAFSFAQSRYDRGGEDDYINCPMNKEEYEVFYEALITAEGAHLHEVDKKKDVYEGCMPIEVLAKRGKDAIRYGPMKPVGLIDPNTGHRPWAVLQLRKENAQGTLYNLVGFQTNLKFGEQQRVFSMIPALKNAKFERFGVMHRNTFIDSPRLLNSAFQLKKHPHIFFAGQITGVEGYMESAASGLLAGLNAARFLSGKSPLVLPAQTMLGALSAYIADESVKNFQPMGAAMGLLPPGQEKIRDRAARYEKLSLRSLEALDSLIAEERI